MFERRGGTSFSYPSIPWGMDLPKLFRVCSESLWWLWRPDRGPPSQDRRSTRKGWATPTARFDSTCNNAEWLPGPSILQRQSETQWISNRNVTNISVITRNTSWRKWIPQRSGEGRHQNFLTDLRVKVWSHFAKAHGCIGTNSSLLFQRFDFVSIDYWIILKEKTATNLFITGL